MIGQSLSNGLSAASTKTGPKIDPYLTRFFAKLSAYAGSIPNRRFVSTDSGAFNDAITAQAFSTWVDRAPIAIEIGRRSMSCGVSYNHDFHEHLRVF